MRNNKYKSKFTAPYWAVARFESTCSCGTDIKRGDNIVYQRGTKTAKCKDCGEQWMEEIRIEDNICAHGRYYPDCDF